MNSITVYHGSTAMVEHPLCKLGRPLLDFGQGFYLTDMEKQATAWASRMKLNRGGEAIVNIYKLDREAILQEAHCKIFEAYDREWLQFIVANRQGAVVEAFDYIEGGVADDRVINTINMYMQGYYDEDQTLRLLALHQPNRQICIRNQALLDKYLHYEQAKCI